MHGWTRARRSASAGGWRRSWPARTSSIASTRRRSATPPSAARCGRGCASAPAPDVKVVLAWSSGKDSAWALHVLRGRGDMQVVALLTTVSEAHDRVAMHAVRRSLLEAQAEAVGLPVHVVPIPSPCPNEVYEAAMERALAG